MSYLRVMIAPVLFGVFLGLWSILDRHEGMTRLVLAMIAGTCLALALRQFVRDVRGKGGP